MAGGSTRLDTDQRSWLAEALARLTGPIAIRRGQALIIGDTSTAGRRDATAWFEADTSTVGRPVLLISDLGWTDEQAATTFYKLASFAEDWDAPGMDAYDAL